MQRRAGEVHSSFAANHSLAKLALRRLACVRNSKLLLQTSLISSATFTMEVSEANSGYVWYFAFGSNMSPETLEDKRGVKPKSSHVAKAPGYSLSFDHKGFPYLEPCYATILPQGRDGMVVHGVVHEVKEEDWKVIQVTEGVNRRYGGYRVIPVKCVLYDGREINALSLTTKEGWLHTKPASPTLRYIGIIKRGARIHKLDEEYISQLEEIKAYTPTSSRQAGAWAILLVIALLAIPIFPWIVWGFVQNRWSKLMGIKNENSLKKFAALPRWVLSYTDLVMSLLWVVHDRILAPIFGEGSYGSELESAKGNDSKNKAE